jgi:toxin YoeB
VELDAPGLLTRLRRTALRVLDLVEAVRRDPFRGPGKPKPLKYLGAGVWLRWLTQEHRMVCLVSEWAKSESD